MLLWTQRIPFNVPHTTDLLQMPPASLYLHKREEAMMERPIFTLVGFVTMAFAVLVTLGSFSVPEVGAVPGTGTLFGTDAGGGNLLTIDPLTGAGTLIGHTSVGNVPALAVDPTTGILYAGQGAGAPNLYTVDPTTGAATLVGDTGLGVAAIGGMDFSAAGTLYAAVNIAGDGGTGSDHLAILEKTTGAATVIGPFGSCTGITLPSVGGGSCTIEGIEAIAFDAAGTLWGARSARGAAGAPGLYTIDPATGAATFVAPILDAFGAPPSGGVVSLQFTCDGTLFGGTATPVFPATDGGRLVTLDPATGLLTFVGPVSATPFGNSLGALAFQLPCLLVTSVTGRATRLGEAGAGVVAIVEKFTFEGDINLGTSSLTIDHLLNEVGGAGELVTGLPIILNARPGGKPNYAIFETASSAIPKVRVEIQTKDGEIYDFLLRDERTTIAFPMLCPPGTRSPTTDLTTSFTIDDGVNPPVAVSTVEAWRCVDLIRGTNHPRSLRTP